MIKSIGDHTDLASWCIRGFFFSLISLISLISLALVIGCLRAEAQSANVGGPGKVQLYFARINDVTFKKGHIEQESTPSTDGKVAFRDCITARSMRIEKEKLTQITGSCDSPSDGPPFLPDNFVGAVTAVKSDGSVQITTTRQETISLSKDAWQKGFVIQESTSDVRTPPTPMVGEFVGGLDPHDNPRNMYVIE